MMNSPITGPEERPRNNRSLHAPTSVVVRPDFLCDSLYGIYNPRGEHR